jgi:hypothetical protein
MDAVHVYAYPTVGGAPIFLGAAAVGDPRPDVAALFGAAFQPSGFHLTAAGVAPGSYLVVAYAHSTVTNTFAIVKTAAIAVRAGAQMAIDSPLNGTVTQPSTLVGWAIDLGASAGTGVDAIHVYAYPNPGSGAAPIFLGFAHYGETRTDIGQRFGAAFTASGFSIPIAGLPAGTYQLVAYAHSIITNSFDARGVIVTIARGERMSLDVPAPGPTAGGAFTIAGWAFDAAAASGTGVDAIHVWAYPASGAPVFLGVAAYGGARPDVAAVFGSRFQNSGFGLNVTGIAPGAYTLVVYAHSTVSGTFSNVVARGIQVP